MREQEDRENPRARYDVARRERDGSERCALLRAALYVVRSENRMRERSECQQRAASAAL